MASVLGTDKGNKRRFSQRLSALAIGTARRTLRPAPAAGGVARKRPAVPAWKRQSKRKKVSAANLYHSAKKDTLPPGLSIAEKRRQLMKQWRALPEQEKRMYITRASADDDQPPNALGEAAVEQLRSRRAQARTDARIGALEKLKNIRQHLAWSAGARLLRHDTSFAADAARRVIDEIPGAKLNADDIFGFDISVLPRPKGTMKEFVPCSVTCGNRYLCRKEEKPNPIVYIFMPKYSTI